MTDRQQELRRQYELLREHLAWLEREIARESTENPPQAPRSAPSAPPPAAHPASAIPLRTPSAASTEDADTLLSNYAAAERHNPESTKRGCLLAFGLTLGLVIITVTTVYFLFYAHR